MRKILTMMLLVFSAGHVFAADPELIYQPKVLIPEKKSNLDVVEYQWLLGISAGQTLVENQDHSFTYAISANYLIWQQWYAAAQLSQKEWQLSHETSKSAMVWSVGAGYSVLEGSAYITDGLTLPWQMYTEVMVGEQALGGSSASYVDGALGWQLHKNNTYAALEWRYFSIDDERLQQIDSDKGYQWSLEFGRYF